MITIKATLKRVIPLKQYENIQPEVEVIEQIDLDMNEIEIKERQKVLLDLCHETLTEYKTELFEATKSVPDNWTDKNEAQKIEFIKGYPGAKEALNKHGIITLQQVKKWCADLKWQWSKIENEINAMLESMVKKPEDNKEEDIPL